MRTIGVALQWKIAKLRSKGESVMIRLFGAILILPFRIMFLPARLANAPFRLAAYALSGKRKRRLKRW